MWPSKDGLAAHIHAHAPASISNLATDIASSKPQNQFLCLLGIFPPGSVSGACSVSVFSTEAAAPPLVFTSPAGTGTFTGAFGTGLHRRHLDGYLRRHHLLLHLSLQLCLWRHQLMYHVRCHHRRHLRHHWLHIRPT